MEGILGKVALVTGAGRGIGLQTATQLTRAGAKVLLADIAPSLSCAAIDEIRAAGGHAEFVQTDVRVEDQVRAMVDLAVERFGGLDIAVNNAGVLPRYQSIADMTLENWSDVLAINLTGVFLCMKHEMRHMRENGGGAIVNISSVGAIRGRMNICDYAASKKGVLALSSCGAVEGAEDGIRVNAVLPGGTETHMLRGAVAQNKSSDINQRASPMGRPGQPSEVADTVLWLCSSQSSFVTGQFIAVDGGATAS